MGKKKSGKKSGKKKGGKKKKNAEPQMTWREAMLAYQINIKEKAIEDVKYELKALEDKNERHKERNERLKEEQEHYIQLLLKQAREFEKKLSDDKVTDKEEVVGVMMHNWEEARQEERNIADLKEQIARKEAEIVKEKRDVRYWQEYREKGQTDHSKQISLLEHELVDMQTSFDEMAAHLERSLNVAKTEIEDSTEQTLDKQKYLATEKAMAKMDKYSRQEVMDNEWLVREVQIHKAELNELVAEVEVVEKANLEMMSELFECSVDDLKISRNFYLTQFNDEENLDETGILEMDLSMISLKDRVGKPPQFIDDKHFVPKPERTIFDPVDEEEEIFDGNDEAGDSEDDDPFNNYYQFDDEDFDDYLKLGPLELKLLSIKGTQMSIYKPATPPLEELKAKECKPDTWPVTGAMLQKTVGNDTPRNRGGYH